MFRGKRTTPKAPQINLHHGMINNGAAVDSSFRVLYYGDASAGSVPFMWESRPGTPKHPLTESSVLPPLTPPPSFQMTEHQHQHQQRPRRSKRSGFFGAIFLASPAKHKVEAVAASSWSSSSVSSSTSSYSYSAPSTPMSKQQRGISKMESRFPVRFGLEEDGDEEENVGGCGCRSPKSTLNFRDGSVKVRKMTKVKKALLSFVGHHDKA